MSADISVHTKFSTVSELAEGYASRVRLGQISLRSHESVAEGDGVAFSVLLQDGMLAFGGRGRCVESIDKGEDSRSGGRFELVLDSLEFEEASAAVFEHLLAVRAALFGSDQPPELIIGPAHKQPYGHEALEVSADEVEALPEDPQGVSEAEYIEAPTVESAEHDAAAPVAVLEPHGPERAGATPIPEATSIPSDAVPADDIQFAPEGEFDDDPYSAPTAIADLPFLAAQAEEAEQAAALCEEESTEAASTTASQTVAGEPAIFDPALVRDRVTLPETQDDEEDGITLAPPARDENETPTSAPPAAPPLAPTIKPFHSQLPPGSFLTRPVAGNSWIPQAPPPMPPRSSSGLFVFAGPGLPCPDRVPRPDLPAELAVTPAPRPEAGAAQGPAQDQAE